MRSAALAAALSISCGVVALLVFRLARGYPWWLAAIASVAIAVLVAIGVRTIARLVALWAPRAEDRDRG